jgi:hypothetical protein
MSVAQAQQCTHWEGEKFDVIATARTKAVAVAAATGMHWGGRGEHPGKGEGGRWTLMRTTFGLAEWQEEGGGG